MKTDRDDITQAFASVLKDLRRKAGMTQEEVAFDSGLNVTHIKFLESASRHPGLAVVLALEGGLKLKAGTLSKLTYALIQGSTAKHQR